MVKMKTLTVSGQTYTVSDPEAVHSIDGRVPDEAGAIRVIDNHVAGDLAWSGKQIVDKLCPTFTENGEAVVCTPVEGYPLAVTAEDGAIVTRCGKNLFDSAHFTAAGLTEKDGAYYGTTKQLKEKRYIIGYKENTQYTMSFRYRETGNTAGIDLYAYLSYTDGTWDTIQTKNVAGEQRVVATSKVGKTLRWINFSFGADVAMYIKDFQLEIGTAATAYVPFQGSETFGSGEEIPALMGVNTLYADSGQITVTGKADPAAMFEKLTHAIIALGGNV